MEPLVRGITKLFSYIVLGTVQGLTEVFPISSSAHLALARELLHGIPGFSGFSFEEAIFLHIGTFFAILAFYRKDVVRLWHLSMVSLVRGQFWQSKEKHPVMEDRNARTPLLMLLSLSITALIGIALRYLARSVFDQPLAISSTLIVNGFIILMVAHLASGSTRTIDEIGILDYAIIGIAQGIAVIPGLSRFGMTLCAGLVRGLGWFEALKLSFLLSLPTVLAASALELAESAGNLTNLDITGVLIGIATSGIAGYLAIMVLLMKSLHVRRKLVYFGVYCIVVGLFFLIYFKYLA